MVTSTQQHALSQPGDLKYLRRMQNFDNVGYFTSFHEEQDAFIN